MKPFAMLLVAAVVGFSRSAAADESAAAVFGQMYWTHRDEGVYRAARNGSEIKLLVAVKTPDGIAIDHKARKLYFTAAAPPGPNAHKLYRVNLDGSGLEEFIVGLKTTDDLVLDEESGKLYLTGTRDGRIFEIDIADKRQRDILTGLAGPDELALDTANRQLYFTSSGKHKIERVGLDGSGRREVIGGLGTPFGLALDVDQNELYFIEAQGNLRRVKLDGSNLTTLAEGLTQPDGLAFDAGNRKLYWTENGKLCQANADGTGIETLVSGKTGQYASILILPPAEPSDRAAEPSDRPAEPAPETTQGEPARELFGEMYWTHAQDGIYSAARDGSDVKLIVSAPLINSIAVDRAGKKLYWCTISGPAQRAAQVWGAEINGGHAKLLAEGIHKVSDLVVDPGAGKLYAASLGDGKIVEIGTDGSGRRDFLTDLAPPRQLLVDGDHRQLYWTSNSVPRIDRIKLDGTGREAVLTSMPGVAFGFALDPMEKSIYWTHPGGVLYRSVLDAGKHEPLVKGLKNPDGLALDLDNRKLYWAENGKISQANLDGTNVEILVRGKTTQYSSLEIFPPAD